MRANQISCRGPSAFPDLSLQRMCMLGSLLLTAASRDLRLHRTQGDMETTSFSVCACGEFMLNTPLLSRVVLVRACSPSGGGGEKRAVVRGGMLAGAAVKAASCEVTRATTPAAAVDHEQLI